jgi:hypothetical protein
VFAGGRHPESKPARGIGVKSRADMVNKALTRVSLAKVLVMRLNDPFPRIGLAMAEFSQNTSERTSG